MTVPSDTEAELVVRSIDASPTIESVPSFVDTVSDVTSTSAAADTVTELSAEVIVSDCVTDVFASAFTVTEPTEEDDSMPVCGTLAAAATEVVPTLDVDSARQKETLLRLQLPLHYQQKQKLMVHCQLRLRQQLQICLS